MPPTQTKNDGYLLMGFVTRTIEKLYTGYSGDASWAKKQLANLRRAANHSIGDSPETWDVLYNADLPEELLGHNTEPSNSETAAFLALTLYAVHQQSKKDNMHERAKKGLRSKNLGTATREFSESNNVDDVFESPIYRRFSTLVQSQTFDEVAYHLRGFIKLLRTKDISIDYGQLAKDLYYLQFDHLRKNVQLSWARQLHQPSKNTNSQEGK